MLSPLMFHKILAAPPLIILISHDTRHYFRLTTAYLSQLTISAYTAYLAKDAKYASYSIHTSFYIHPHHGPTQANFWFITSTTSIHTSSHPDEPSCLGSQNIT